MTERLSGGEEGRRRSKERRLKLVLQPLSLPLLIEVRCVEELTVSKLIPESRPLLPVSNMVDHRMEMTNEAKIEEVQSFVRFV